MRILGIIPARGGSKGIPRKNIADVCGFPLISYSIRTGLELVEIGSLSRCIVSTDDEEIATISRRYGADVPFIRPVSAATDTAKAIQYVLHALDALEPIDGNYDAIMILQPTSPIRDAKSIALVVDRFRNSNLDSLISCYHENYINELVMYDDLGDGTLAPRDALHNKGGRRQDQSSAMVRNGVLYITRVGYLKHTGQIVSDNPMLYSMRKVESIDVDTPDDLELLRAVISYGNRHS